LGCASTSNGGTAMSTTRLTLAAALLAASALGAIAPAQASADSAASAAAYRVTLKSSASDAVQNEDKITLSGKVTPKAPGAQVTIQIQYEGKTAWKSIGTTKVKKDGTYSYSDKPTSRLDRSYRVVKPADKNGSKGTSKARNVEVFGWDWLNEKTTSANVNVISTYAMPINGADYRNTLYVDRTKTSGYSEWTLGRKCTELRATFGLSDRTETGGKATIKATTDGTAVYVRAFSLGESEAKTIDVTDVYRVRLDFWQTPMTPVTEPSAGAAKVLCD
jgi:hypothetical protein